MNYLIHLLLISSSLSIKIGEAADSEKMKQMVDAYTNRGGTKVGPNLTLSGDGWLGQTEISLVWQGFYRDVPVAIKIVDDKGLTAAEMHIFETLNAIGNENVACYGIPTIYYHGPVFKKRFYGIAMTLFDGTLELYYQRCNKCISYSNLLSIFRQMMSALQYLNGMNVVHNDIKPDNIFFRDDKFFIGDFGAATYNGTQNDIHTPKYASSNYHAGRRRGAMDDLQSLVFTMWFVSGITLGHKNALTSVFVASKKEGEILNHSTKKKYIARIEKKLKKFNDNQHVYGVFKYIAVDEMLSSKLAPDYDLIIGKLDEAIGNIGEEKSSSRG